MLFEKKSEPIEQKLFLGNNEIKQTNSIKILGMISDPRMPRQPHMNNLVTRCTQRINIMKTIGSRNWGAGKDVLMETYKAHIHITRTKLEYGASIYRSA